MMEMRENKAVRHIEINSKIVEVFHKVATLNVNGLNIPFKSLEISRKAKATRSIYDVL